MLTFSFLNDKIDQNNNFAKLPSAKWIFFGIIVHFSLQILKSIYLVCLSFWDMSCDPEFRILISVQKMCLIINFKNIVFVIQFKCHWSLTKSSFLSLAKFNNLIKSIFNCNFSTTQLWIKTALFLVPMINFSTFT